MRAGHRTIGAVAALSIAILGAFAPHPARADLADLPKILQPEHMSLKQLTKQFEREDVGTVYFDFDKASLDPAARARLDEQASFIRAHPGIRFSVTGHTDKVGNLDYNKRLGLRRANRVVAYLVASGIERSRLVAMVSFGEEQPVINVETRERRNRRVLTRVIAPDTPVSAVPATFGTSAASAATPGSATAQPDPATSSDPGTTSDTTRASKSRSLSNAGRGNGDEPGGDPAGSVGNNRGGDEMP